ncbi:MAG: oxygenase MpaB family protein, partial [Moraxellaceae bacterium]|nr:oxygenase MpaB family protein [Moraxellaceae bacterium]
MVMPLEELKAKVLAQKTLIPSLYGDVDFSITPERFTDDLTVESMLPGKFARKYRMDVLADRERVERARAYTMLGDTVADAYAALMPQYGFRRLIDMLTQACDHGIESVPDAPAELVNFIAAMERIPDWLDMELVNEGARLGRIYQANMVPFAIRGAFIATFMNKYSGLPMALTGALTDATSVQRVKETASFFTTATLPGALERYGAGFKAAAMVRLMHSMVRFNILKRSKKWDVSVYGIPVPQVDQMPAGTMVAFITAFNVIRKGRDHFTREERGAVELNRYQSYLLGLPEDLLPDTPRGIFNAMITYAATLRDGYDDETNGALVRSTMSAYLPPDDSLRNQVLNTFEKGFAKVF